jgi:ribonuclease BN (tRNA processing enzyme)
VEITFLGTGAAFSATSYNSSALVGRTLLLDAGPPLCVHLPRVGVAIEEPRAVLLSHFHADHTFGLATLLLGRALTLEEPPPLEVFGPEGTARYLEQLLDLAWGDAMRELAWSKLRLSVRELRPGDRFDAAGLEGAAYEMRHSRRFTCLGYVVGDGRVRLGYTGDAEMSDGLRALLSDCDHVIAEMTYREPAAMHLARTEVERLMGEHPAVRFLLTHRGPDEPVDGAILVRDFQRFELPLPDAPRSAGRGGAA